MWAQASSWGLPVTLPMGLRAHRLNSCPPKKSGTHSSEELLPWVCQAASGARAFPPQPRPLLSPFKHWLTALQGSWTASASLVLL